MTETEVLPRAANPPPAGLIASGRPKRRGDGRIAGVFLLPASLGFLVFYLYPAIRGVWYSMTDWNLLSEPTFVGTDNYRELVNDPQFWGSLRATFGFVFLTLGTQLVLALALAALMHRLARSLVLRATLMVPWLVPNVTVGLLWLWLLDTNLGFVNNLLRALGGSTQGFLTAPHLALSSIAGITTWSGTGFVALLFYAGMLQIPSHVYESAGLDGAGELRIFWRITLPLLRPIVALVLVVSVIGSFQVFDIVAVTTGGDPMNLTKVIYFYIYEEAFQNFRMGYATALALSLLAILSVLTYAQLRLLRASTSDLS